jgi:hypothetical protein
MKTTDKMRITAVSMWFTGGLLTVTSTPVVSSLTMISALLFGAALILDTKEKL